MALHWTCVRSVLVSIDPIYIDRIPGSFNDRRSPLGELNWIFTAITDTIAWLTLPPHLFNRLFRQDPLVASLMRNFLLAERILKACNCTPETIPSLPPMNQHPLWYAWDLSVDFYLAQLPKLFKTGEPIRSNPFFPEQLTAFEVWLEFPKNSKPEQLPIVLQVLLSKQHRKRALRLLAKFLDLGPNAVSQALSVGTFPYVLKLLQCPAEDLREDLVFIWSKILAVDSSCSIDLVREHAENYFIPFINPNHNPIGQCIKGAFIVSSMMDNQPKGKASCLQAKLHSIISRFLNYPDKLFKQWIIICIAKLWEDFPNAQIIAIQMRLHEQLFNLLTDSCQFVRTASVYAIGMLINSPIEDKEAQLKELSIVHKLAVVTADMSSIARKELIFTLIKVIFLYENQFNEIVLELTRENLKLREDKNTTTLSNNNNISSSSSTNNNNYNNNDKKRSLRPRSKEFSSLHPEKQPYARIWRVLLSLRSDPHPDCSILARRFISGYFTKLSTLSSISEDIKLQRYIKMLASESTLPKSLSRRSLSSSSPARLGSPKREKRSSFTSPITSSIKPEDFCLDKFKSQFYSWAKQYFVQNFSEVSQEDDLTAPIHLEREWRRKRQERFYNAANDLKEIAGNKKFEKQIALINDNRIDAPSHLKLHPNEPLTIFSDNRSMISVWNWRDSVRLTSFTNPSSLPISSLSLMNTHHRFQVLVGTADGAVRVWGSVDSSPTLLTSWRAFPEDPMRSGNQSLVFDWNENENSLVNN